MPIFFQLAEGFDTVFDLIGFQDYWFIGLFDLNYFPINIFPFMALSLS